VGGQAYTTYARWSSGPTFLLNPANADVSADAAEAAIKAGLDVWNTQSGSSFAGRYAGRVSDTATANDGRNVIIFRNASNGSAIATTYSWWSSSNTLLDTDLIFWDGGPTQDQTSRADALARELADVSRDFEAWATRDLAGINNSLRGKKLEPIAVPTRQQWEAAGGNQ